jgi:hypothetical protein
MRDKKTDAERERWKKEIGGIKREAEGRQRWKKERGGRKIEKGKR